MPSARENYIPPNYLKDVMAFHNNKGVEINVKPTLPSQECQQDAYNAAKACGENVAVSIQTAVPHWIARDLLNMIHVAFGIAIVYGIPIERLWRDYTDNDCDTALVDYTRARLPDDQPIQ